MAVEVTQGGVKVISVELIADIPECVIYKVNTQEKRPNVMSWGMCSLTLLQEGDLDWLDKVRPEDYTVVRFPELKESTSAYFEERYCVYFMQFSEKGGREIWH